MKIPKHNIEFKGRWYNEEITEGWIFYKDGSNYNGPI